MDTTRVHRQTTARATTGTTPQRRSGPACGGGAGMPVLGRAGPGAATAKHSEVALVCADAAKTPVLATSGAYSVRQQYWPGEVVAVVGPEVAAPATKGLADPTWAPPRGHPPAVARAGRTCEKVSFPVGAGPQPPVRR